LAFVTDVQAMKIDHCPGRGHTEKMQPRLSSPQATTKQRSGPVVAVLLAVSFAHLLNDTVQAVIPAIYPLLKESFQLSFGQVGLITLTFQLTASILQPIVGLYADHRPVPFSLATGMGVTLVGLILLSVAGSYALLLIAAALVGLGSSIFHPEASRVARLASGGKHGLAQSLFQVGGNAGTSFGPLLAAIIVFRMVKQISGGSRWLLLLASSCSSGSEGGIESGSWEIRWQRANFSLERYG
jgi:MFS transporter, FSR family, fosmidomycin resistance protein